MENTTLNDGSNHESKKPVKRRGRKAKSAIKANSINNNNTNTINSVSGNNNMRRRYEMAYYKLLNELPHWKLEVIKSCKANKNFDDRVMNEFVRNVILLAEDTTKQILLTA